MADGPSYYLEDFAGSEFARYTFQGKLMGEPLKIRLLELGFGQGARCLEVGPGAGELVRWMVAGGARVTAYDITDRWFGTYEHERVDTHVGDVRDADIGSDYDFVVASWVLHHLPERWKVVARLAQSLRPGGWLIVSEPALSCFWTASGPSQLLERWTSILRRFNDIGVDYDCGPGLPEAFEEAGLGQIDAAVWTPLQRPGSKGARLFDLAVPIVCQLALERGWASEADVAAINADRAASNLVAGSAPAVVCWGQRAQLEGCT